MPETGDPNPESLEEFKEQLKQLGYIEIADFCKQYNYNPAMLKNNYDLIFNKAKLLQVDQDYNLVATQDGKKYYSKIVQDFLLSCLKPAPAQWYNKSQIVHGNRKYEKFFSDFLATLDAKFLRDNRRPYSAGAGRIAIYFSPEIFRRYHESRNAK